MKVCSGLFPTTARSRPTQTPCARRPPTVLPTDRPAAHPPAHLTARPPDLPAALPTHPTDARGEHSPEPPPSACAATTFDVHAHGFITPDLEPPLAPMAPEGGARAEAGARRGGRGRATAGRAETLQGGSAARDTRRGRTARARPTILVLNGVVAMFTVVWPLLLVMTHVVVTTGLTSRTCSISTRTSVRTRVRVRVYKYESL